MPPGRPPTSKAIARFHIGLSLARFYKPQIERTLSRYLCESRINQFFHKAVKGYAKRYSHNDPALYERAEQLIDQRGAACDQ
jgi:hypothetical protein